MFRICALALAAVLASASVHAGQACDSRFAELQQLVSVDQAARQAWIDVPPGTDAGPIIERVEAIDRANTAVAKALITDCGWPADRVASHRLWLLVQHADRDMPFQRAALVKLRAAAEAGGAAFGQDLAYLEDRVALAEGNPQLYGTQFSQPEPCVLEFRPLDDRDKVEARRKAVGLPSLAEYLAFAKEGLLPQECSVPRKNDI